MGLLNIFKTDHNGVRRSHIKNLLSVAMADGTLEKEEWDLVVTIARLLGVSEGEIEIIRQNPETVTFVAPRKYEDKVQHIHDLVALVTIDGQVNERELALCRKISLRLDILPQMVDDIISGIMHPESSGPPTSSQ
jgi:uncharacterized tellurite resistance protein B-like protein